MLKNYTSEVPVERTVARIEAILAEAGAVEIMKEYKNGRLNAICFSIQYAQEKIAGIRLPAKIDSVFEILKKSIKQPRAGTMERLKKQAERTGWKLQQDWVEVQMSLIQLQQADFLEIFLPYVWDGEKTFYTHLKEHDFKLLPEKKQ